MLRESGSAESAVADDRCGRQAGAGVEIAPFSREVGASDGASGESIYVVLQRLSLRVGGGPW